MGNIISVYKLQDIKEGCDWLRREKNHSKMVKWYLGPSFSLGERASIFSLAQGDTCFR